MHAAQKLGQVRIPPQLPFGPLPFQAGGLMGTYSIPTLNGPDEPMNVRPRYYMHLRQIVVVGEQNVANAEKSARRVIVGEVAISHTSLLLGREADAVHAAYLFHQHLAAAVKHYSHFYGYRRYLRLNASQQFRQWQGGIDR